MRRGIVFLGAVFILGGSALAKAPPAAVEPIGRSGAAVTFAGSAPVPLGYYNLCKGAGPLCRNSRGSVPVASGGVVRLDDKRMAELVSVNAAVNRSIRPLTDRAQFRTADRWSVSPRSGDCEDYALTKKAKLLALGWPSSALLIALAFTKGGDEHAVLIARTDGGDLVLDNLRRDVRPWTKSMYRWKSIQAPNEVWAWHRVGGGTIRIAGVDPEAKTASVVKVAAAPVEEAPAVAAEPAKPIKLKIYKRLGKKFSKKQFRIVTSYGAKVAAHAAAGKAVVATVAAHAGSGDAVETTVETAAMTAPARTETAKASQAPTFVLYAMTAVAALEDQELPTLARTPGSQFSWSAKLRAMVVAAR